MNFTNLAVSKLNAGISSTDLSLTLLSGNGDLLFASSNQRACIFSDEYANAALAYKAMKDGATGVFEFILISARTSDVCTITRAQEGTTAQNFNDESKTYSIMAIATATDFQSYSDHVASTSNPHSVTKSQVGLANADNTSDANKPVSSATQTALNLKQNIVAGVDDTEIGYLNGVTSAIQTQLNAITTAIPKRYKAVVSYSGSFSSTVVVNTLGGSVAIARSSTGVFTFTTSGLFVSNKTSVFVSPSGNDAGNYDFFGATITSTNVITVSHLRNPTGYVDNFTALNILIEVEN